MARSGVTATVAALSELIESGNPLHKDGELWTPHRPARPEKSEGGIAHQDGLRLRAGRRPAQRHPRSGRRRRRRPTATQVLLGVTGSGKTFTMAKVIEETQRPALILAPNKTLAAQLYSEFKNFFPENAVEYFVSYYDYYQPEAYVPRTDTYHREGILDQRADRPHAPFGHPLAARARRRHHRRLGLLHLRHRLGRDLHGDDLPDAGRRPARPARAARRPRRPAIQAPGHQLRPRLVPRARRHHRDLPRPPRGPRLAHLAVRRRDRVDHRVRPADRPEDRRAEERQDLRQLALCDAAPDAQSGDQVDQGRAEAPPGRAGAGRPAARGPAARAAHPLRPGDARGDRLLRRHRELFALSHRPPPGEPPPTLFEYIPDNALVFVDESHVTIPQIGGMYRGDFRRKATLAEYGFRLPSCMDNRPLRFEEWDAMRPAHRRASRRRPAAGRWSSPAACSPSRSSARPG